MDSLALGALESIDANDALVAWELRQRRRDQSLTGTSKSGEAEESNAAAGTKDNGEGDLLNELIFARQICTEIIVSSGDEGENNLNEGKPYIGTLLVTNQRVAWISEDYDREKTVNPLESSKGAVQIDYRALNMHAVCSQDSTVQERSCIYCQLLPKLVQYSAKGEEEEDGTVQVIFSAQESLEEEVSSQFQDAEEHGSSPKVSANNENDEDDDDEDGNAYGEEDIEETDELIEVRFVPENQTSCKYYHYYIYMARKMMQLTHFCGVLAIFDSAEIRYKMEDFFGYRFDDSLYSYLVTHLLY